MNKWVYFAIGICIVVGIYLFFKKPNIKNYPPRNNTIVLFGDSLARGYGSTKDNDIASLLSKKLGQKVVNLGVDGNTSADGLVRVEQVIALRPGIVIVSLGGNDFLRKTDRTTTEKNLSLIIEKLQSEKIVVILLGVRDQTLFDSADSMYERLAKKYQTGYVSNILSGIVADTRYMFDAIHPNDAGYTKIVERIYPVVIDLI
jgi:lysophospholipase L1-like esterase